MLFVICQSAFHVVYVLVLFTIIFLCLRVIVHLTIYVVQKHLRCYFCPLYVLIVQDIVCYVFLRSQALRSSRFLTKIYYYYCSSNIVIVIFLCLNKISPLQFSTCSALFEQYVVFSNEIGLIRNKFHTCWRVSVQHIHLIFVVLDETLVILWGIRSLIILKSSIKYLISEMNSGSLKFLQ